ncbi:MAG: hypothetical protein E7546_05085 [Ruminococcaceae bacterium]|nr:hypothetical protein [Oscillospiraceae bacterium]
MEILWIALCIAVFIAAAVLVISYICFRMAFYVPDRDSEDCEEVSTPKGEIYDPYRERMEKWTKETRAMPQEEFSITSFDGLTLFGKYYEYKKGAPIELMFHGYRGNPESDLSGGVQRCFKLGRSSFIVDQRCSRKSGGNVITFGINEHRDCLCWIDFMIEHFGPDVKIILTGISMGASTVLMAAGKPLPKNVIGVLADCGYSSPKDIIKKVIRQMGLPASVGYFFVKLGARIYGHFDLEETSPESALKNCTVPVIFFHGEDDAFVPCDMSRINYEACSSKKKIVTVPGAGHGLSYPVAPEKYLGSLREFFGEEASYMQ